MLISGQNVSPDFDMDFASFARLIVMHSWKNLDFRRFLSSLFLFVGRNNYDDYFLFRPFVRLRFLLLDAQSDSLVSGTGVSSSLLSGIGSDIIVDPVMTSIDERG